MKIVIKIIIVSCLLIFLTYLVVASDTIDCPCKCTMGCKNVITKKGEVTDVYATWEGVAGVKSGTDDIAKLGEGIQYWTGTPINSVGGFLIDTGSFEREIPKKYYFNQNNDYKQIKLNLGLKKTGTMITATASLEQNLDACPQTYIDTFVYAYDNDWGYDNKCRCMCQTYDQDMSMEFIEAGNTQADTGMKYG